ncbi:hypothetical protein ES703_51411 [subsurface metagenome]
MVEIKNHNNMRTGLEGEQLASSITFGLGISHTHNNFDSLGAYESNIGKGADIRSDEWKFHMEVKRYFSSWLDTEKDFNRLIGPRFEDTPVDYIKFTTVIGGIVTDRQIAICNRRGIIVIHAPDERYLDGMLAYYYRKYGIGPQYKRPSKGHRPYNELTLLASLEPVSPALSPAFVSSETFHGKGPPDSSSSLANLGSWVSFNNIGLGRTAHILFSKSPSLSGGGFIRRMLKCLGCPSH